MVQDSPARLVFFFMAFPFVILHFTFYTLHFTFFQNFASATVGTISNTRLTFVMSNTILGPG